MRRAQAADPQPGIAAKYAERGYELQFRTHRTDGSDRWTSVFGSGQDEAFIRSRYIHDAAMDYDARPDEYGDVEWRIVRVLEEEIEPPRTSQQVFEWLIEGCAHCGQTYVQHSQDQRACVKAGHYGNKYEPPSSFADAP